mmetsp:Transcript_31061/g.81269  ORF Transcript_31061/g.81269 Transcript_31061/m.81269 type:complete len:761 (+) Transcript_31061:927-3209(+)
MIRYQSMHSLHGDVCSLCPYLHNTDLELAFKVKMDVISWQERKQVEQQAWVESVKVRVKHARHDSAEKQHPLYEAAAERYDPDRVETERNSSHVQDFESEPRAVRASHTQAPPPTPRLAAARKARAEAVKKMKAAATRAAAKRVSSRKKEARRTVVGALPTMLNNFSNEDIVQHAVVVVQAVADVDQRVRIAARDAIDRFLASAGKLKVHPMLPVGSSGLLNALIRKIDDNNAAVRQTIIDLLVRFDQHCLASHASRVVAFLKHSDSNVRMTALKVLNALEGDAMSQQAVWLAPMLNDQNADVRRLVVHTMMNFDERTLCMFAEGIIGVLSKPDVGFRRIILTTLLVQLPPAVLMKHNARLAKYLSIASAAELRDASELLSLLPPAMISPCLASLVSSLEDSDLKVRSAAAAALRKLDPALLEPSISAFMQKLKCAEWEERACGLQALGLLSHALKQSATAVLECLDDDVLQVRCNALEVVHLLDPTDLVELTPKLISKLDDAHAEARRLAISVLKLVPPAEFAKQAALDFSVLLLHTEAQDSQVRAFAVESLGLLSQDLLYQRTSADVFVNLLRDRHASVRRAAVVTLARFQTSSIVQHAETIVDIFINEKDARLLKAILNSLFVRLGAKHLTSHKDILDPYINWALRYLKSSEWKHRRTAAVTLGALSSLGQTEHCQALVQRLDDARPEVSKAACESLSRYHPTMLAIYAETLVKKLREANENARMGAVKLLSILMHYEGQRLLTKPQQAALSRVGAS